MFDFDKYLEKTPREKELNKELMDNFAEEKKLIEESGLLSKRDKIYGEIREEMKKRLQMRGKMVFGDETQRAIKADEATRRVKEIFRKKAEEPESEELKAAKEAIKKLSKKDIIRLLRVFDCRDCDLDNVSKRANVLINTFVQLCIDYCKQNNLTKVDSISFNVDGLSDSMEYGEWTPATDASLAVYSYELDKEGQIGYKRLLTDYIV